MIGDRLRDNLCRSCADIFRTKFTPNDYPPTLGLEPVGVFVSLCLRDVALPPDSANALPMVVIVAKTLRTKGHWKLSHNATSST